MPSVFENQELNKNQIINYDFDYVISNKYFPNNGTSNYNLFPSSGNVQNTSDGKFGERSLVLSSNKSYSTKTSINTQVLTMVFWLKQVTNHSANSTIISLDDLELKYNGNNFILNNSSSSMITLNDWTYIAIVKNSSNVYLYANGTLLTSVSHSNQINGILTLGSLSSSNEFYLNDFKLYQTVITTSELDFMRNTPMAIDDAGNIWCKEINNNGTGVEYYSTGKIITPNVVDNSDTFEIYEDKIATKEIKQLF